MCKNTKNVEDWKSGEAIFVCAFGDGMQWRSHFSAWTSGQKQISMLQVYAIQNSKHNILTAKDLKQQAFGASCVGGIVSQSVRLGLWYLGLPDSELKKLSPGV